MTIRCLAVAAAAAALLASAASAQSLTAADFAALPAMESPSLSPNGEKIAFITYSPDGGAIVIANLADMTTTHFITTDSKPRYVHWVTNDKLIYALGLEQGLPGIGSIETTVPYGADISGRLHTERLLQEESRTTREGGGSWQRAGGGYIFFSGASITGYDRENGRVLMPWFDDDANRILYSVDPSNDRRRAIDEGVASTFDWVVDETGEPRFRAEYSDSVNHFRILARVDDQWEVIFAETLELPELDLYGLDANGDLIVGTRPEDTGRYGLYVMSSVTGEIERPRFVDDTYDITSVDFDPATNRTVGAEVDGVRREWFDPDLAREQALLNDAFPGENPYLVSWSDDRSRFVVRTESPDAAPAYFLYDATAHTADLIASAYPQTDGVPLPERLPYSYAARDGEEIPAYLTRPLGQVGAAPLVVLPHGGPESRDVGGFDWIAHFLASRGYVVLQPEFRGSYGFGAAWRDAGRGQWGTGVMQHDVSDGVTALIAEGIADPARVCIVGGSYGGYAALAGATFTPKLYACAVAIAPVSDLEEMLSWERDRVGSRSATMEYWRTSMGGDEGATRARMAEASPAQHVEDVSAPILLIHGRDDAVVPIRQSQIMQNALRGAGKSVELIELNGEDHWLSRPETRLQTLEALEAFLAEHLR